MSSDSVRQEIVTNIMPDAILYISVVLIFVFISQYLELSQDTLFGLLTSCIYIVSIVRITRKIERKKMGHHLRSSVFTYGFICGAFYWFLFVLSEFQGISELKYLNAIVYTAVVGLVVGLIAVLISWIIRTAFAEKSL